MNLRKKERKKLNIVQNKLENMENEERIHLSHFESSINFHIKNYIIGTL